MRRRRWGLAVVVALGLALLGRSGGAPMSSRDPSANPGPASSWLARRGSLPRPAPAAPEPADPEVHRSVEVVVVPLREAATGFVDYPRRARLEPREFWPALGQVAFPPGDTAPLLEALLDGDREVGGQLERRFLAVAWEEGVDAEVVDIHDPWASLLALEVERRRAEVEQQDEYHRALDDGLGPERGQITADALVGPVDLREVDGLAQRIVDVHPDHPVAEYARLFQLDAAARSADPGAAWALAIRMLEDTRDPLVLGQAVGLLTTLPRQGVLEPSLLDWVGTLSDDLPEVLDPIDVAAFGLDHAMMADDLERSRRWIDRLGAAVDALCEAEPDGVGCAVHTNHHDEAVAYIGDLDVVDARDWRQALEIAGFECARLGHDWKAREAWRVELTWDGAWRWAPWEGGATSYTACVEDLLRQGPDPDPGTLLDIRLSIVR